MAAIRTAAITEFSLFGLAGTSTHAIATRAGLSKPQLHYYIAGKEELYEELLMHVLYAWKVDLAFGAGTDDPAFVLARFVIEKLDHAIDQPEISRIFTREVLDGGQSLNSFWPHLQEWTKGKIETIQAWVRDGRIRPLDPRLLLIHIWSMTQSYADMALQTRVMLGMKSNENFDRTPIKRELITFILLGCGLEARAGLTESLLAGA